MLTSVQASRFPPLHSDFPSPIIVQSIVIAPSVGLTLMSTASICNVLPLKGTMPSSGIYWKSRACKWNPSVIDIRGARTKNATAEPIQHLRTFRWWLGCIVWDQQKLEVWEQGTQTLYVLKFCNWSPGDKVVISSPYGIAYTLHARTWAWASCSQDYLLINRINSEMKKFLLCFPEPSIRIDR